MTIGASEPSTRSGILFVDKPAGITSHDVVSRVRRLAGTRKVGHAGTLDPMATGLLTLGINSSTRLLTFLVGLDKEYYATIRFGAVTDTDDAQGSTLSTADPALVSALTYNDVQAAISPLTGEISQVPSSVSAIRVDGRRAYELARAGETVELKSRQVTVSAFEILAVRPVDGFLDVDVRVECSSGTYIRALARDAGSTLGVGGHLTALRRSRVGPFSIADATELDKLEPPRDLVAPHLVAARLFPTVTLDAEQVLALSQGKRLSGWDSDGAPMAALSPRGTLVGLVSITDGVLKPIVNFPTAEVLV
ncbi:MAG TPA: tRNA pseudouridine(55) synthase TruB [Glaciihabitans sp.]|nr:tRNA pseudouridine(55) synthase TruB [Glaciihabitans sp.]